MKLAKLKLRGKKVLSTLFFISFFVITCSDKKGTLLEAGTDFCSSIHRDNSTSLSKELAGLTDLMKEKTGVYVLEDGAGSMVARAWLTEYAEKTIDIQYFIFSTDNVGLIACDYLVRAADRGIQIRIIVDDIMIDADPQDLLTFASHENITVKVYNPNVKFGANVLEKIKNVTTDFRGVNQRMHNKTFVVDDKVVITGGRNIADEYFDYDHEYNFRDRDILLLGKTARDVSGSFESYWSHELCIDVEELVKPKDSEISNEAKYERLHEYACNPENFWPQVRERISKLPKAFKEISSSGKLVWLDNIQFVSDEPGKNAGDEGLKGGGVTTEALIELIQNAETSIDIQTPYFITTDLGKGLFKEAVDRGVKVRILTNSLASTDNVEAFSSYQSDRKELLDLGIEIYEFRPDAAERIRIMTGELQNTLEKYPIFGLHAKSMIVDNETTVIGTFNLDPRSANLNTECVVILKSEQVTAGVLKGFETEFQPENSWRITEDFNPDDKVSKGKRFKTWTRKVLPKAIL